MMVQPLGPAQARSCLLYNIAYLRVDSLSSIAPTSLEALMLIIVGSYIEQQSALLYTSQVNDHTSSAFNERVRSARCGESIAPGVVGGKKPIVQATFEEGKSEVFQIPSGVKVGQCI